jgi:hypothetical protein
MIAILPECAFSVFPQVVFLAGSAGDLRIESGMALFPPLSDRSK